MKFDPSIDWFYKYPSDTFGIEYDFTNDLSTGETLSSATASCYEADGTDKTASMVSATTVTSPDLTFDVGSGTAGKIYTIKVVGTTSDSNVFTHYISCEVQGAVTLNTKLGDFNANSYVTVEEANEYILNKYGHVNAWDTLSTDSKKRILIEATREIDRYNFIDDKYYDSQPLSFPRDTHDVKTGACATPLTTSSFKNTGLKSTTYNTYPQNYWKYGTCHLKDDNEAAVIASSNVDTGLVHMTTNFTASLTTNTNFVIFAPLNRDIKHAQIEQALYVLDNSRSDTIQMYQSAGARSVKIGDVTVEFKDSSNPSKLSVSSISRKLLGPWIAKRRRVLRA